MFGFLVLTPLKAAAVLATNSILSKLYVTARYRYVKANNLLGNPMYVLPDSSKLPELADGHTKQDPTWKRVRASQLNEAEWAALCLPLCLYFDLAGVEGAGPACSIMAWTQVGYWVVRAAVGFPFHMPFAITRYAGVAWAVKILVGRAFPQ